MLAGSRQRQKEPSWVNLPVKKKGEIEGATYKLRLRCRWGGGFVNEARQRQDFGLELLQSWVGPHANHLFSDVLGFSILIWVLDVHYHQFVPSLRSMHVDTMKSKERGMRKSVERRETRQGLSTGQYAITETRYGVEAVKRR
jgi:hypothetical protein